MILVTVYASMYVDDNKNREKQKANFMSKVLVGTLIGIRTLPCYQ
jgi:hypothetical protein